MAQLTKENIKKNKIQGTNAKDDINLVNYAETVSIYAGNGTDTIGSGSGKTTIYGQSGKNIYNISVDNTDTTIIPAVGKAEINIPTSINESHLEKIKNDLRINIAPNNIVTIKDYFKNRGEILVNGMNLRDYILNYNFSDDKKVNLTAGFTNDNIQTNQDLALNDSIKSLEGNDYIVTYGGNDTIYAGDGNDTINGGAGNDKLYGGLGINLYSYANGKFEGNDTIYAEQNSISYIGINADEIKDAYKTKNDLILANENGEKLTLANYFKNYNQEIFINGESIKYIIDYKKDNSFEITGKGKIEDTLFNDSITGSKGADKIYSNVGNDKIIAGQGNDKIYSYSGEANLYFIAGDGKDTLDGRFNQINITTDINSSEPTPLKLKKVGNNLIINYTDKDSITLNNYYIGGSDINSMTVNGTNVIGFGLPDYLNNYQNEYKLTHGNNKFYSMDKNNKIILPNEFDINNVTKISKSGNNLVITGVWSKKDKLTIVDYYKDGYDITFEKENGSNVGSLNQLLLDVVGDGNLSGYNYGLKVTGTIVNDNLTLTNYDDIVKSGHGHDTIYGNEGKDTIYGGTGNDSIYGNDDDDNLYGDDGNDYIDGGYGNNTLKGGKGNDTLHCYGEGDKAYGETGNDYIEIKTNNVYVDGGSGNDHININSASNNKIYAGSGNDYIYLNSGETNKIDAGSGNDQFDISYANNSKIYAGSGNDTIIVTSGNFNEIEAGSGNDFITVHSSDNEIEAGSGNDFITVHSSNNEIEGGNGNDYYTIHGSNEIEDSSGNDYYNIAFFSDTNISIEDNKGKDTLYISGYPKSNLNISFDVQLNSKNKVVEQGDIDVVISNSPSSTIIIDDYFGSGCIERIESNDGYYITKTQMQNVLQEVAAWLTTNGYSSTEMAYRQNGNEMPAELTAIFNDINWQQ